MKTIESVRNQENMKLSGPVTIGNIMDDARIEIDQGSLLVTGNVGKNVSITCTAEKTVSSSSYGFVSIGRVIIDGVEIGGSNSDKSGFVTIEGNVADNVNVKCDGEFNCNGKVGDSFTLDMHSGDAQFSDIGNQANISTYNGNIIAGNIGKNSKLKTHNGNISGVTVKQGSEVTTHNGNANFSAAEANTLIKTHNGNVHVVTAHETATVKTTNGQAYVNGRRVEQPASQRTGVHINNVVMHGSARYIVTAGNITVANGRVIVDGEDISELADQASRLNANI